MKTIISVALTVLIASAIVYGVTDPGLTPPLQQTSNGVVQGYAPNGNKFQILTATAANNTVDNRKNVAFSVYGTSDFKFRLMSTATRVGALHTIPGGSRVVFVKHWKTPYVNFSSASGVEYEAQ